MRRRIYVAGIITWVFVLPLSHALAEPPLQEQYLRIYLEINDAEQLEKQGDFRGALNDFQDCYAKLEKIHDENPSWETALVLHRMDDCKSKILDLRPKAAAQAPAAVPVPTAPTDTNLNNLPVAEPASTADGSDDAPALKRRLQEVEGELETTKANLKDSQTQLETYRDQLATVNSQLSALKTHQAVDDKVTRLLNENKILTDRLVAAEKQIDDFKVSPKSRLGMVESQLKNLQGQFDESQAANKALQITITTLQERLDQAQSDLVAANAKLAVPGPDTAEYTTIKRENEVMRGILQRELQEQARRDEAKRLAQEEFDNLKLKSKVLQEQLDILGSPMTPATTDEERALLASLKVPGPDLMQPPASGNTFSASAQPPPSSDASTTNTGSATLPSVPASSDTNTASATPPATGMTPSTDMAGTSTPPSSPASADSSTNAATSMPSTPTATPDTSSAPATVASANPSAAPDSTNAIASATPPPAVVPDTNVASNPVPSMTSTPTDATSATQATNAESAPISPGTSPAPASTPATSDNPPATNAIPTTDTTPTTDTPPTTTQVPPGTTTVTTTTISNGANAAPAADATQYSVAARLPDEMRETAQQAADLFTMKRYDESAAKYQSIIDKYPESLYAWSNLGVVRFQQGTSDPTSDAQATSTHFNEALKALQQAVKLSPTDAFSYSNLGIVYYQLEQYENAIDALNAAKALDPNDAKTRNYLGCACSQKGWTEAAEKEFRKAIELDPTFGDAHFNLALVYAEEKPPVVEMARQEYKKALELGIAKDDRLEKLLQSQPAP